MTLATSIAKIRELGPCAGGYRFALSGFPEDGEVTAQEARDAGCSFEDMAWYLSVQAENDAEINRRLRMWKADVAAHVLPIYEQAFPHNVGPRLAIITARCFVAGTALDHELDHAISLAQADEDAAFNGGKMHAGHAAAAARVCGDNRHPASWVVSRCAFEAVGADPAREIEWQYDRLIEWFTGDGPEPLALTARSVGA